MKCSHFRKLILQYCNYQFSSCSRIDLKHIIDSKLITVNPSINALPLLNVSSPHPQEGFSLEKW